MVSEARRPALAGPHYKDDAHLAWLVHKNRH
jgi:hypothetical protein